MARNVPIGATDVRAHRRALPSTNGSAWSSSGPRRRSTPASATRCAAPVSTSSVPIAARGASSRASLSPSSSWSARESRPRDFEVVHAPVSPRRHGLAQRDGRRGGQGRRSGARQGRRRVHERRRSAAQPSTRCSCRDGSAAAARPWSSRSSSKGRSCRCFAVTDGTDVVPLGAGSRLQAGARRRHRGRTPAAWAPTRRRWACDDALVNVVVDTVLRPAVRELAASRRRVSRSAVRRARC